MSFSVLDQAADLLADVARPPENARYKLTVTRYGATQQVEDHYHGGSPLPREEIDMHFSRQLDTLGVGDTVEFVIRRVR